MIVIGCDTGLANFGVAVCDVDHEKKTIRLIGLDLFVSQAVKHTVTVGKRGGITKTRYTASANFERTRNLGRWMSNVISYSQATCVCFESMSTGASVGAPASLLMGAAFGVVATIANYHDPKLHMHTPQQVKNGLGLKNNATKDQVHDALFARFPNLDDMLLRSFRENKFFDYDENCTDGRAKKCYTTGEHGERSHPCDALATIVATWPEYKVVT